ncbi:SDR family NAD(P)-dependent oxidoreductase [Kribbella sp. NPDC059898]|uniref:SDR family NAD(P)-dependent oxidoreductase n=1 Tax=Kribbella sp. NPDC059898 TaxID=3346995 RepID=UPI00365B59AF
MKVAGSIALVTGANRGLGARLVQQLLAAGAAKVYATSRGGADVADPRVVPLTLDVTDEASVQAAVAAAPDVTLLVNNAGVVRPGSGLTGNLDDFEHELATNYLGTLRVTRAFVPVLAQHAPAAIVNVLTLLALAPVRSTAGYSASKAAAHSMTQSLRGQLRSRGITVVGVYPGSIDTDMIADVNTYKASPELVAERIVTALAAGETMVFPDDASAAAGAIYLQDPLKLEQMLTGY